MTSASEEFSNVYIDNKQHVSKARKQSNAYAAGEEMVAILACVE